MRKITFIALLLMTVAATLYGYEYDMSTVSLIAQEIVYVGIPSTGTIKVENVGTEIAESYNIQLWQVGIPFPIVNVPGPALAPDESYELTDSFTPVLEGTFDFFARVQYPLDEDNSNNETQRWTLVSVSPYQYDLATVTIIAPDTVKVDDYIYLDVIIKIQNVGTATASDYYVHLKQVVNGVPTTLAIESGEILSSGEYYETICRFMAFEDSIYEVYGEIDYSLDQNITNNKTHHLTITSISATSESDISSCTVSSRLIGNYPNPFNPHTRIFFSVASVSPIAIDIFNVKGQHLCKLVDGVFFSGEYSIMWDGHDKSGRTVPSGIYFYRMNSGDYTSIKKMVLLK